MILAYIDMEEAALPAVILLLLIIGMAYLYKKSSLKLSQLVVASILLGALLLQAKQYYNYRKELGNDSFYATSFCLVVLAILGLFVGSRNYNRVSDSSALIKWFVFISGFLLPVTATYSAAQLLFAALTSGGGYPVRGLSFEFLLIPATIFFAVFSVFAVLFGKPAKTPTSTDSK